MQKLAACNLTVDGEVVPEQQVVTASGEPLVELS
jgi:hypothetical protein